LVVKLEGSDEDKAKAIGSARARGLAVVDVIVEERGPIWPARSSVLLEAATASATSGAIDREYRVIDTRTVASLEKEVQRYAADGFRATVASSKTVVMERDPRAVTPSIEYRAIATRHDPTAERELNALGTEGFRLSIAFGTGIFCESLMFVQREPGGSARFQYRVVPLREDSADQTLTAAEAAGFRVVALLGSGLDAVLERTSGASGEP
jgi:hypothetical protein